MDGRRAALAFVVVLLGGLAFLAAGSFTLGRLGIPNAPILSDAIHLPWALAATGPAAVLLLREPARDTESALARVAAIVLPGASLAFITFQAGESVRYLLAFDGPSSTARAGAIGARLLLVAAAALAGAHAWRTRTDGEAPWLLAAALASGVIVTRTGGVATLAFTLMGAQLVLFVASARWRRSPGQVARAVGLAAILLVLELVALLAIAGSVWPPSVNLDGRQAGVIIPLGFALPALVLAASLLSGGAWRRAAR